VISSLVSSTSPRFCFFLWTLTPWISNSVSIPDCTQTHPPPTDALCPSFLPHYSRLPLKPVLTDTTSKFSHKLSSISANRRHEHTQTHTHKYDHLIQISSSKKETKANSWQLLLLLLKASQQQASKQTNKQTFLSIPQILSRKKTNKHLSRFLKSCQAYFLTTRVPIPTKLTTNYKLRICAATT